MRLIKFLTLASLTSTVGLYKLSAGDNNNTTNIKNINKNSAINNSNNILDDEAIELNINDMEIEDFIKSGCKNR